MKLSRQFGHCVVCTNLTFQHLLCAESVHHYSSALGGGRFLILYFVSTGADLNWEKIFCEARALWRGRRGAWVCLDNDDDDGYDDDAGNSNWQKIVGEARGFA